MSLINEALKKAQRQRQEDGPLSLQPSGGGTRFTKRSQPKSTSTVVLLGSGALVIVVLSVVATVYFINRPTPSALTPAAIAAQTPPSSADKSLTPAIARPLLIPSAEAPANRAPSGALTIPASAPTPAKLDSSSPSQATISRVPSSTTPSLPASASLPLEAAQPPLTPAPRSIPDTPPPVATTLATVVVPPSLVPPPRSAPTEPLTAPAVAFSLNASERPREAPKAPPAPPQADPRVTAFVDTMRVSGFRSAGPESRVLINGRVYKIGEIVERTFALKLSAASVDRLTFSDAQGFNYIKIF